MPRRADRAAVRGPLRPDHPLALHQAEQALTLRVTARLGSDASARLAELAAAAGNDEADNGEPQALSLIKSVPGNVSLESMLTEIAKLDAVRAAGLPDAAKASSHRPQATLVTQPKIAAPCEDDRAIQQNARSGSAGTVSQPTQEWRQIGGSRMMAAVRDRHAARLTFQSEAS